MKRPAKEPNIIRIASLAVQAGHLQYSFHANERMRQRGIIKPEVEYILLHGHHEARKDQFSEEFNSWDYAIKGTTVDGRRLRIVVAYERPHVLVITAIDLDQED